MKLLLTLVVLWSLVTPAHAADEEFWNQGTIFSAIALRQTRTKETLTWLR